MAVFGFVAWLVLTNSWTAAPYTPAAPYHAAFLLCGFLLGRRVGDSGVVPMLTSALAFALGLAGWATWERTVGNAPRAHALFDTPAVLALTLNFVLLPVLALVAAGTRTFWLLAVSVVLTLGVIGTGSRGGWLALAAGLMVGAALLRRAAINIDRRAIATVMAIFVTAYLLSLVAPLQWDVVAGTAPASARSRLDLYLTALAEFKRSSWLLGSGYMTFHYVVEAARPSLWQYENSTTYYVHNDYLQALLELGFPGLALLLLLAASPLIQAWKLLPQLPPASRTALVAVVAASVSMAVHALVDFPFYIPLSLFLYGTCTGFVSAHHAELRAAADHGVARQRARRIARVAFLAIGLWLLFRPAAAQTAAAYAHRQWDAERGPAAAYWLEVARRVEPRDWRYHWYVGRFWLNQAFAYGNAKAAALADVAFAAGFKANPREVANLVARLGLHLQLRDLLTVPADSATLRSWDEQAMRLSPLDPGVKAQHEALASFESGHRPK